MGRCRWSVLDIWILDLLRTTSQDPGSLSTPWHLLWQKVLQQEQSSDGMAMKPLHVVVDNEDTNTTIEAWNYESNDVNIQHQLQRGALSREYYSWWEVHHLTGPNGCSIGKYWPLPAPLQYPKKWSTLNVPEPIPLLPQDFSKSLRIRYHSWCSFLHNHSWMRSSSWGKHHHGFWHNVKWDVTTSSNFCSRQSSHVSSPVRQFPWTIFLTVFWSLGLSHIWLYTHRFNSMAVPGWRKS